MNEVIKTQDFQTAELIFDEVKITCPIESGHRMVPVKTICTIVNVDYKTQDNWLKKHPFFAQLYRLAPTTGADNKTYDMRCLPIFDVNVWLGSISMNNRKEGSIEKQYALMTWLREQTIAEYKSIEVFKKENEYEKELMKHREEKEQALIDAQSNTKKLKGEIAKIDQTLEDIRISRFTGQTALPFPEN